MPTITIRDIPEHAYDALRQIASQNNRSINSELINLIGKYKYRSHRSPQEHIIAARKLRKLTENSNISVKDIANAINEGRP